jgi:hypothetical protein
MTPNRLTPNRNPLNTVTVWVHGQGVAPQQADEGANALGMPEHRVWQMLCHEARHAQKPDLRPVEAALRELLQKRKSGTLLPQGDAYPREHELAVTPAVAQAWQTYKRQLLRGDYDAADRALTALLGLLAAAQLCQP